MNPPRLAIIVPYRDRKTHLEKFLPNLLTYFEQDAANKNIPFSVHVVEQAPGKSFNRGMIKNIGFDLAKDDHDYFCFHDVDYLPISADYSYTERPTRLIWWGLRLIEDYERFFGGVIGINKADFTAANGYSNDYWGWGCEDLEFAKRCETAGLKFKCRGGAFESLPHEHAGTTPDNKPSPEALASNAIFLGRQHDLAQVMKTDGLSSVSYRLENKTLLPIASRAPVFHYLVTV